MEVVFDKEMNNVFRGVAQLVARSVRVAEAVGSSPTTPTTAMS